MSLLKVMGVQDFAYDLITVKSSLSRWCSGTLHKSFKFTFVVKSILLIVSGWYSTRGEGSLELS